MKQLFERIIAWGSDKGIHSIEYNPLVQIGFLIKELAEVNDEFIAGNIDKAVGEICDLIIFVVNALMLLDWHNELLDTDFDRTVIKFFDNNKCMRLLSERTFLVIYAATTTRSNNFILCDKYTILIGGCFDCIESLGYSPELALEETVKKIESRQGAWDGKIGKWVKTATLYEPDYSIARLE